MNIAVQRDTFTELSTAGVLLLDGNFECYTLEPPVRDFKPCCIPDGNYPVVLQESAKFGFVVPCVLNVPGFTAIEIHTGNKPDDTEGCCLVGQSRATDWVANSKDAFAALMAKLQESSDDISITYVGGPEAV